MRCKTPDGKPICFNFNYGRCRRAQAGKRCDRGYHVCFWSNKPHNECTHDDWPPEQVRKPSHQELDSGPSMKSSRATRVDDIDNSVSHANNIDNQDDCTNSGIACGHLEGHQLRCEFQSDSVEQESKPSLVFVEIFAGSTKLSASAHERGFRGIAVDHGGNKHTSHHEISLYDLTSPVAQSHFAPRPFRDEHHPFGYPWLQGSGALRVICSTHLWSTCCFSRSHAMSLCRWKIH